MQYNLNGRAVSLTPISTAGIPAEALPFLDVSRPDVVQAWAALGLNLEAGGGPTPGAVLAQIEHGNLRVNGGRLVAAPQSASRFIDNVPPRPQGEAFEQMKDERLPLEERKNWAFCVQNRDSLSNIQIAELLGCHASAVERACAQGRLPRRGHGPLSAGARLSAGAQ